MAGAGDVEDAVLRFYDEPNNEELHQLLTE